MIYNIICEECGNEKRVQRGANQSKPRFCSNQCRWAWQRKQGPPVDRQWLYQKYWEDMLSCPDIAKLVDRDPSTVRKWLVTYNIKVRPRGSNYKQNLLNGRPKGWHHTPETKEKLRRQAIESGRVPYLKNGKHHIKGKRGGVVHNWKGGITPERQAFYNSPEWKRAAKSVWMRDNALCQRCGLDYRKVNRKTVKFHIHHIVSFEVKGLRANLKNLVLLCHPCHMWVHSSQNVDGEFISRNGKCK